MTPIGNLASLVSPTGIRADALATAGGNRDPATAGQAAAELEGMFVSLLLKQMRSTVGGEGLFGNDPSDVYGGLFDLYLGNHLAQAGGLGLGKYISTYLEAAKTEHV